MLLISTRTLAQSPQPTSVLPSGQVVEVTDRGTVELHVADLPLSSVLELLSLQGQKNIVASPKVSGRVTANLYGVTFEQALDAVLASNGAGYRRVGGFIYVYTQAELDSLGAAEGDRPATRVFHLNYLSAADAKILITPVLAEKDLVATSPSTASGLNSDANAGGGSSHASPDFIVVTAKPDVLRAVERILAEIDVRPRQVLVEATILRAELTSDNALGIDFSLVGGVDLQLLGATSNGIRDITLGRLPTDRLEQFNAGASTDFRGNVPDGGLTLGVIKDQVAVFLRALEQVTDTTVLANPKILAVNRQKGQVIVGRRDGYLTTTVTETQAVQTVQFLETGTTLIFRPFIGDDGWVRVELHPEDSVGFVNAQGLPSEQTTEVTTNVMVRDRETILIGGLFREVTSDKRSQVPGLGSLPGVGGLFRSNNDSTGREEVIILLTIHVVKDQEAYGRASTDVFENLERLRVGMREGLMWHGRTRLAQWHYHRAVEAQERGDDKKAEWHADMCLGNSPRFLPAMEMKERILGRRAWEDEAAASRTFIHELIARDRGVEQKAFGRPNTTPSRSPTENAP
ncbi:MAG: secretin and TonB N-terminal domain-containing protein [Planctomycetota bacterium]